MPTSPTIHIGSLRVRMAGTSPDAGRALAQALRDQLADLPATHAAHLGALHLRIPAPSTGHEHALPGAITAAISRHLAQPSRSPHA